MQITLGCSIQDYLARTDFQAFEWINLENPLYPGYLDGDLQTDIRGVNLTHPAHVLMDGPYIDLNPGSPEPASRALAVEKVRAALCFAAEIGAEEVVFLSTFLPFIGLQSYEQDWIENSIRSWRSILQDCQGVRISLCNTFEFTPEPLLAVVEAIDDPRLGMAFDVGHCLVWGKLEPAGWYRRIRKYCRVVYLHSNDGNLDTHLSIRSGVLMKGERLPSLLAGLRADSLLVLKYFDKTEVLRDVEYLREMARVLRR